MRNYMNKVFQAQTSNGTVPFSVRIEIPSQMFGKLEEHAMREEVEAILSQRPVIFVSGKEKRAGIKMEPGFYEFWTTTKYRLRTSNKPALSNGMVLLFDKFDKGMH
ncbi:hypothetical protein GO613_19845 [Azoarcus communis]|uniref:hypothetical protein n=1 Tax=Parazoarcus communis TaxID=41977 RepID=UPI001459C82C|nr:hypothetical protein [Parazoarcus communis]NMG50350.1 hypothetical protein [Parazoarcus communis]